MSSLDLLDYQVGLDEALARPGPDGGPPLLPAPLRRQAVKEARRVVDAMAFRFALLDERPLPEDLDYLRALEAVKDPARAAQVLARRKAHYASVRRRRLATTWTILALLGLVVGGGAWLVTSEKAETLALVNRATSAEETLSPNATFYVGGSITRLRVDGSILLDRHTTGGIEVRLIDPDGVVRLEESFFPQGNVYLRENVNDPKPGLWTLLVDFNAARGSARVEVLGVSPAR